MELIAATDPLSHSADLTAENIERVRELFPQAVTENGGGKRIDFDVLRELLGGELATGEEKYGLNWHGKRAARRLALTPSTGTLRPAPEDSVDWDTTQNLMIEGDNLEVLKLLQKSYAGKVKMIYIDPPYNTGRDFVYKDDFRDSIGNYQRITGQRDNEGAKLTTNAEGSGRFHTDWLNMMYPRLLVARNLLRTDGVLCISIDDGEQASVRNLCDSIFGEENFVSNIVWQKRYVSNVTAKWLSDMHDFVVVYARNKEQLTIASWDRTPEQLEAYKNPDNDQRGVWRAQDLSASKPYSAGLFTITGPTGLTFRPPPNRYWRCNEEQFSTWLKDKRIWWGVEHNARPMLKSFLADSERGITPHTWWTHQFAGHNKEATLELKELFSGDAPFDTPKPVRLLSRLLGLFTSQGDVAMDFFAGSGPLGHACFELSIKAQLQFILVQVPEQIERKDFASLAAVTEERLRRASKKVKLENPLFHGDLGFRVFKLDTTSIRPWDPTLPVTQQRLLGEVDNILPDRTEQDLLYELLLKRGLELTVPIVERTLVGKQVFAVSTGDLIACLAPHIESADVEALAEGIVTWYKELAPPARRRS